MSFERTKKRLLRPQRVAIIKIIVLLIISLILNITILILIPEEIVNILISTSILVVTLFATILFDYIREMNELKRKQQAYQKVADMFSILMLKTFRFLRLPRETYFSLNGDTLFSDFRKDLLTKSPEIIGKFLEDASFKHTDKMHRDLAKNLEDGTLSKSEKGYIIRKKRPLKLYNQLVNSPYFNYIEPTDQQEIILIKDRLEGIIEVIDNSASKTPVKRKKDALGDTSVIRFYIRYLVLAYYVLYYKANLYHPLSWGDIKSSIDRFEVDDLFI